MNHIFCSDGCNCTGTDNFFSYNLGLSKLQPISLQRGCMKYLHRRDASVICLQLSKEHGQSAFDKLTKQDGEADSDETPERVLYLTLR